MKLNPDWIYGRKQHYSISEKKTYTVKKITANTPRFARDVYGNPNWDGLADAVIEHIKHGGTLESAALMLLRAGVTVDESIHICSKYLTDIIAKTFN